MDSKQISEVNNF